MYNKILVGIDGSETSQRAFDEALKLAKLVGGEIRALYVVDSPAVLYGVGFYDPNELKKAFNEEGILLAEDAKARFAAAGITGETRIVDTQTTSEDVVEVLAREASEWPADLIVLGTHGRRGVRRALLGSVAEAFMRIAPAPVLLVRTPEED